MTGTGRPRSDVGGTGAFEDASSEWFAPNPGGVALLERPGLRLEDPSAPSDSLSITPDDVRQVLGPDAEDLLASVDVGIEELITLLNAETTMMPALTGLSYKDEPGVEEPEPLKAAVAEDPKAPPPMLVEAVRNWKRKFLRGAVIAALVTLTGGGATAMAMNKSVTVDIDGQQKTVSTYASTVADVLKDQGLSPQQYDALSPSPTAAISDGGKIVLERGRLLKLTVDGQQQESWVRSRTVGDALRQLGVKTDGVWMSEGADKQIPLEGASLEMRTPKQVTVFDGGKEPQQISTNALTVGEMVQQLKLELGPQDSLNQAADVKVANGSEIYISRTGITVVNKAEPIEAPVTKTKDDTLDKGKEQVDEPGAPGEQMVTYRITMENGKEVKREKLGAKVTKEAKSKVVRVGTKPAANTGGGDGVWDRLAGCEATGNWSIVSKNGKYHGGLQFDKGTWISNGGGAYAPVASQATREQQIEIATKVRDARGGYSAWPHCASKLGLPK